jgi:imidazolonepropionase
VPEADVLVTGASEVATPAGEDPLAGEDQRRLRVIEDGVVAVRDGRVAAVGPADELASWSAETVVDADGGTVVPGFVDAHTHPVFAGHRAHELARKLEGASYEAILEAGGGIHSTVRATRAASLDELVDLVLGRLDRALALGTTTLEAKTGYALTVEGELGLLEVLDRADREHAADVVATLLGAHAVPEEADRGAYVERVADELTARAAEAGVAAFCDAFVDEGAFTVDEGRRVLEAGAREGMGVRVHADELACTRATRLGLDLDAASIDHVNRVHEDDVAAWADRPAPPAATLCPVTPFTTQGVPYAEARELVDAGVPVALGSDLNPNAYSEGMWFTLALAVHGMRMAPAEALVAATANSAASLGLDDRGRIAKGLVGDLVVLDVPGHEHVGYRMGGDPVRAVVKDGCVVRRAPGA